MCLTRASIETAAFAFSRKGILETMDVTVVGYGMGKAHCDFVNSVDGLNLYALCDIDETRREEAKRDFGVKTFETLDQVLDDGVSELIVLATPHDTHAPLSIKAMDAGKNVIVEKVMCLNVAEADAMIEASRRNNVKLSVFQSRRWDSDYLTVKKVIGDGILGEVFMVESSVGWYGRPEGWRRERRRGGGQIYDWGAHLIDQAIQLVNSDAKSVFCNFQYRAWDMDAESCFKCLISFENQLLYEINVSTLSQIDMTRWRVQGELGTLTKQYIGPDEKARVKASAEIGGPSTEMEIDSIYSEWREFYVNISKVFNEGAELAVKPEEVRKVMVVIEAAIASADLGQAVRIN